jgi:hypothetical protein
MKRLAPTVAIIALSLAGCGEAERQTQAPAPTPVRSELSIPYDLAGTWLQTDTPGAEATGFLSLGQRRVVLNFSDLPRGVSLPTTCDVEAGSGRLVLDNGLQLFVSRGQTAKAMGGGMVVLDHLDIDMVRAEGSPSVHRRLWSEASLRLASHLIASARPLGLVAAAPVLAEPAAVAPVPVEPNAPAPVVDLAPAPVGAAAPAVAVAAGQPAASAPGLVAAVPASRRPDAEDLVRQASGGVPESSLAASFGKVQGRAWSAALDLIEQAHKDPAQRQKLLARAAETQSNAEIFASAVAGWKR